MLRIGPYRIKFGRYFWTQSKWPITARRFLFFWIIREYKNDRRIG